MEVKGTAVEAMPKFISEKFGQDGLNSWIGELSEECKKIFSKPILSSQWYPLKEVLVEPTLKFCSLFYKGDIKGALDMGRYSAELGLKGIYKVFVKIGSTEFLIKKASTILPTYYNPSAMEVVDKDKGKATIRITQFPEPHEVVDLRIKGWMEEALAISGAKDVKVDILQSMASGAPTTDFAATWN
jgi:hypothetical protein